MTPARKPPIGLFRRKNWQEHCDKERFRHICEALHRYTEAGCAIPPEWIEEYNDLVARYEPATLAPPV